MPDVPVRPLRLSRRSLLRGAGAALPLPLLNLMNTSQASTGESAAPLRFLTLFKPNGVHPPSWNISGGQENDFRLSPLMKPFEQHKEDVLILDNMGDFGFSSHANSTRRFLSGHHRNTDAASIDQIIADKIAGDTRHRSLELTTEGLFTNQIGCSYISYNANGAPLPRESDPQLIFDRLFRNPIDHAGKRAQIQSVLDRVLEDARQLNRRAGSEDRQKLDEYFSVLRSTEKKMTSAATATPRIDFGQLERPPLARNLNEQVEAMLDLICLALWTDSTRCTTYMLGNSNSRMIFDFLGITEQHHYLSHFFRNFSRPNLEALLKISVWHMQKFDSLLSKLKSYREGEGTLLDNTLVLYGSGMGHSDNHTVKRIPIVLAGAKRFLKTGRYVRYAENQQLGRLHLSLLGAFGIDQGDYAGSDTALPGLDGSAYDPFLEKPFESWVNTNGDQIQVQGRIRMSDDLDEAKLFFVDVAGKPSIKIEVSFRDFHQFNLAYHCGTAVTVSGTGEVRGDQTVITKVTDLRSVHGKLPGTQNG
ncbi:MAG: DUF1552 domain-containing protein [Planctomycetota bacterium]